MKDQTNEISNKEAALCMYSLGMAHGLLEQDGFIQRLRDVEGIPLTVTKQVLEALRMFRSTNIEIMFNDREKK